MTDVTDIKGIGPTKAETLAENGFESVEDIATADKDELAAVDGVGDDRALEFIVGAKNIVEELSDDEVDGEQFDLTPADVAEEIDELDEIEEEVEEVEEVDTADSVEVEEDLDGDPPYAVDLQFESRLEYDTFHAALMRHHEDVYTSNQPAADAMQKLLDGLAGYGGVTYELTEYELNTLHTAVKQARTEYQGDNLIDHMDALKRVEQEVDEYRRRYLF